MKKRSIFTRKHSNRSQTAPLMECRRFACGRDSRRLTIYVRSGYAKSAALKVWIGNSSPPTRRRTTNQDAERCQGETNAKGNEATDRRRRDRPLRFGRRQDQRTN